MSSLSRNNSPGRELTSRIAGSIVIVYCGREWIEVASAGKSPAPPLLTTPPEVNVAVCEIVVTVLTSVTDDLDEKYKMLNKTSPKIV